ncbi:MAG: hypothetical protein ABSF69_12975 [Polyangiaceae bacterium]
MTDGGRSHPCGIACAFVAWVAVGLAARPCRAESCPAPTDAPGLADVDAEARLAFLARSFDREIRDLDLWSWTWGSIYVGAAVAQGVAISLVSDAGLHKDLAVGAVSAAIGSASLFGLPLTITLPLRTARRHWSDVPRCRLLGQAEDTLIHAEKKQRLSAGWVPHVGNLAFNAGLVAVLGWGFGRWKSAAISAGIGTAVGEVNVLTQPHHLADALERYRAGKLDDGTASSIRWSVAPLLARDAGGLLLRIDF